MNISNGFYCFFGFLLKNNLWWYFYSVSYKGWYCFLVLFFICLIWIIWFTDCWKIWVYPRSMFVKNFASLKPCLLLICMLTSLFPIDLKYRIIVAMIHFKLIVNIKQTSIGVHLLVSAKFFSDRLDHWKIFQIVQILHFSSCTILLY